MDTQTIQARFSSQEQAESAVRKLAALRGDRFRIERHAAADSGTGSAAMLSNSEADGWAGSTGDAGVMSAADGAVGVAPNSWWGDDAAGGGASAASFTLSANVPLIASGQAGKVIQSAGGEML